MTEKTSQPSDGHRDARTVGAAGPLIPDYELVRKIGEGSYGEVWLARGVTGAWRAVKIVWRNRFSDAEPFEREFRGVRESMALPIAEAQALAVLHVGRDDGRGLFFYVMELADDANRGADFDPSRYVPLTLKEIRHRRGRLPIAECVTLGTEIARGLAALHQRGLVHRDIKPSNVILVNGAPKLADIGLVAPASDVGTFVGTEGYVPPEGPGKPAADVFALGKVLYELATGQGRQDFPRLPENLGAPDERRRLFELNEILLRACEPDASKRYTEGAAMLADLEALQAGRSLQHRRKRRRRTMAAVAGAGVVLALAGVLAWKGRPAGTSPQPTQRTESAAVSIAVLPFANVGGDKEQEYIADGLTEEILDALARERDLRVPGRASSFSFKGKNAPAPEIGRTLNVAQLVEGSVQRLGSRMRIRVSLTRTADGFSEPLGGFDREVTDLFALQDEVARAVVEKLTQRTTRRAGGILTKNADAYDCYLRGRALQVRAANHAPEAARLYEQAVALDPSFALAWARLAAARFRGYGSGGDRSPVSINGAREAIERALTVQPDLPEGLIMRANWQRSVKYDFAAAGRDLARAESLQPATAELRQAQAALARDQGDWPEYFRRAQEVLFLDPQNGDHVNAAAVEHGHRGRYAEADRLYVQAMAIAGPGDSRSFRNRIRLRGDWRGPEAGLRLLERTPPSQVGWEIFRTIQLLALDRTDEARAQILASDVSTGAGLGANDRPRVQFPADVLWAAGMEELARERATAERDAVQKDYARGNHAPSVYRELVVAATVLGERELATALLVEWRRETQISPSVFRRMYDFHNWAVSCYAMLGEVGEAVALLRELQANGYHFPALRSDPLWTRGRRDPRMEEFVRQDAAWAATLPDPEDDAR